MRTKYLSAEIKRSPTDGSGTGTAIVYVFGAPDSEPLLDAMYVLRDDLRLYWSHDYFNPSAAIGKITDVRIDASAVEIDFALDLESDLAVQVYEKMLRRLVTEFSVGFRIEETDLYEDGAGRLHARTAELIEVSAVPLGANRSTELISIKAATNPDSEARRDAERLAADRALVLQKAGPEAARLFDEFVPARRSEREPVSSLKARIAKLLDHDAVMIDEDSLRRERALLEQRMREERKARKRRRAAARQLDEFHAANIGTKPTMVLVDRLMRPIYVEGESEREADQRARELAEIEAKQQQRDADLAAQPQPPQATLGSVVRGGTGR